MRNKDRKDLEDFYYAALYDAIHTPPTTENLAITIRRLTAKIRRLSSQHMHGVLMDMEENDVLNEDITTYHYIQSRKRSKARLVTQILDNHGDIQNDKLVIMNIFTTFLESKYRTIQSDTSSFLKMTPCGMPQIPAGANIELEHLITMEGLQTAVNKGKSRKSPSPDGICHEYYKYMWNCCKDDLLDIINNMFLDGAMSNDQKHGHILCLPKASNPASPEHYRPLIPTINSSPESWHITYIHGWRKYSTKTNTVDGMENPSMMPLPLCVT